MGFLNNTTVTVDAILTKKGRELLAQGTNAFNITKFALADDEVDYRLWDTSHPNGTDYYGTGKNQLNISNNITVLDVEVNGASKLLNKNNDFIGIFIDIENEELIRRLELRGHDKIFIKQRMDLANKQRSKINEFDYVVKNVDISTTVKNILDIIYTLEESW